MLRLAFVGPTAGSPCERIASRLRHARLSAVADPGVSSGRAAAQRLDTGIRVNSFDTLLVDHAGDFDAVVLVGADRYRGEHARRAAAAGKHVLLNGPLAPSRDGAVNVIEACRAAGVRLMVGQELRFSAAARIVKASLDDGKLGRPGLLRIHRWESRRAGGALQAPGYSDRSNWTLLLDTISEIDLGCWFFGSSPQRVYAVGGRHRPGPPEEPDYVQLHLGFAGGGMALIDFSQSLPGADTYFSLSLIGSTGAVYADDHHNRQLLFGAGGTTALSGDPSDDAALRNLQEFVDAVVDGREPALTGDAGLRALDVAEAAAVSLQIRDAVVPESAP